ncbi:MAG: beta-galactosidase [Candidatus Omnitrophica bacterium]|nr:beta-galactosidase [Candidatus Omnitrophota bacterium]
MPKLKTYLFLSFFILLFLSFSGYSQQTHPSKISHGTPYWWNSGAKWKEPQILRKAYWIWNRKDMLADMDKGNTFVFSKKIEVPSDISKAFILISAQGYYKFYVNGKEVGSDTDVVTLDRYDVKNFLKHGENSLMIESKSDTWYAGLFVAGTVSLKNGKKLKILSNNSWNIAQKGQLQTKPAAELVRGVNGGFWNNVGRKMVMPSLWYKLNTKLNVPGIGWANPYYAGGKIKVLVIQPRAQQRDTVELVDDTNFNVSTVFSDANQFNEQHSGAPFFEVMKGMSVQTIEANIKKALRTEPDVIILGGFGYDTDRIFKTTLEDFLKTYLINGGGLIYLEGAIPDKTFEKEITANIVKQIPDFLNTGFPYKDLPGFKSFQNTASLFTFGKGRIVCLNNNVFGGYGLFANVPSDTSDLDYQYYMLSAIKEILWTSHDEPATTFKNFPEDIDSNGKNKQITFTLLHVARPMTVTMEVMSKKILFNLPEQPITNQGEKRGGFSLFPVYKSSQRIKQGKEVFCSFNVPFLPSGKYYANIILSENGKYVNWATAFLSVNHEFAISQIKLSKKYIDVADGRKDSIGATVTFTKPAPENTVVEFSLIDNYYRILATKRIIIKPGSTHVNVLFPVSGFITTLGKIHAALHVNNNLVSVKTADFTAIRRDWNRFTFFAWTAGDSGHQGNVYLRELANLGLDASRGAKINIKWLEAADMVALPAYPILSTTEPMEKIKKEYSSYAAEIINSQLRFDPIVFNAGDEFYYPGGDESPAMVMEFRKYLENKYKTIQTLNNDWGTNYSTFEDIYPLTMKDTKTLTPAGAFESVDNFLKKANSDKNYSRYLDQWLNDYNVYFNIFKSARQALKKVYPYARVGVDCPMWPDAYSGHDWFRFMQDFDYFAPYGRNGEIIPEKEARSYKKQGQFIGLEYGGYNYMAFNRKEELTDTAWQHWRIWNGLLNGFTSIWWYQLTPPGNECNLSPGFLPYSTLKTAADDISKIRDGYYTLFNGRNIKRIYGPVAIYDSIRSRLVDTWLPSEFGSGTLGNNMDVHVLMHILQHFCGMPYTFISSRQILNGELGKYKVLMMPESVSIKNNVAKELIRFVKNGGILIADVRPGIFNGKGEWNDTIPSLFGISYKKELKREKVQGNINGILLEKKIDISSLEPFPADASLQLNGAKPVSEINNIPLLIVNQIGKGKSICLNIPFNYYRGTIMPDSLYAYWGDKKQNILIASILNMLFRTLNIHKPVRIETENGKWPIRMAVTYLKDGQAQYIGITRQRNSDSEKSVKITIYPPVAGYVYNVLTGKYIGKKSSFTTLVHPVDVGIFSVLPYKLKGIAISSSEKVRRGETLKGEIFLQTDEKTPANCRHVIHLSVIRPDGKNVSYLSTNLQTDNGKADFSIPFVLNEPKGKWKLQFTDVATGILKSFIMDVY